MIGFFDALARAIKNPSFYGRSTQAEYWWFQLFGNIVSGLLIAAAIHFENTALFVILAIFLFIFALINLPLTVRRLHDIGLSGWNILLGLIPFMGPMLLIVYTIMPGDKFDNKYGPNPRDLQLPTNHLVETRQYNTEKREVPNQDTMHLHTDKDKDGFTFTAKGITKE